MCKVNYVWKQISIGSRSPSKPTPSSTTKVRIIMINYLDVRISLFDSVFSNIAVCVIGNACAALLASCNYIVVGVACSMVHLASSVGGTWFSLLSQVVVYKRPTYLQYCLYRTHPKNPQLCICCTCQSWQLAGWENINDSQCCPLVEHNIRLTQTCSVKIIILYY